MEKICTTKFLPPSITEESELSFSALKIISFLQNSDSFEHSAVFIEENNDNRPVIIPSESVFLGHPKKTASETPVTFNCSQRDNKINSDSLVFEKTQTDGFLGPLQGLSISPLSASKLNESVDMFDDSSTQVKETEVELDISSSEIELNRRSSENTICLDEVIDNNFIKNKKKITHYFPIRRKHVPKLTSRKEIYDNCHSYNFKITDTPPKYDLQVKPKKMKKSKQTKSNVQTLDKYLHNHLPEKSSISLSGDELKSVTKVKEINFPRSSSIINFSTFASGTFKTIKDFSKPTPLVSCSKSVNDFQIRPKSSVKDISNNVELKCFSENSGEKCLEQAPFIKKYQANNEHPMTSHILYLSQDSIERANKILLDQSMREIGFTLCFKEGFCLLNKPAKNDNHSSFGLLLCINYLDDQEEFIFFPSHGFKEENLKKFLLGILRSSPQKICYEAQAFIRYVLENIDIADKTICYDWCLLDPLVAFWLLDPDHPAASFDGLLQLISFSKLQKEENCWSECCAYLKYQSHTMGYVCSELQKHKLWDVFFHIETRIISILAVMETSSILINTEILKKMSTILHEKLNLLETEAEKMVGHKFSFKSPLQISKVLFEELKLDEGNKVTIRNMARRRNKSTSESTNLINPFWDFHVTGTIQR